MAKPNPRLPRYAPDQEPEAPHQGLWRLIEGTVVSVLAGALFDDLLYFHHQHGLHAHQPVPGCPACST